MNDGPTVPFLTPRMVAARVSQLDGSPSRVPMAAIKATDPGAEGTPDSGTTGELWLYGIVGGWWRGFDAESVSNALRGLAVDTLVVRIHSPGGNASDGVAIANLLRNHKAHVRVVVDGLAASAASIIAIAGDEIVMCPGSQMMLHDASTISWGNADALRSDADWIDKQSQNYAGVYAYRAGGNAQKWRQVMLADDGRGTWFTAEEAVTAKLADKVGTVVAVGSPPVAPEDDFADEDAVARAAHDLALLEHCVPAAARAAWTGQQPPKPPSASAVGSTPSQGMETAVAFSDEQLTTMRQKLGIAEDADEATILAALDEALDEQTESAATATTPKVPDGHVVVPQAQISDLQTQVATLTQQAQAGAGAAEQLRLQAREAFLDENKTKFAPANREAWAKEFDRDPEGTRKHFESAPEIVPIAEIGHEVTPEAGAEDEGWFPGYATTIVKEA